ncbi:hypothetical protein F5Y16DRAFT_403920 [Xylariaceae sp. FL0255]|nr:hypothetical protein F5Y16DRAFT_403920 [Xylariaceae sp. FL0255]
MSYGYDSSVFSKSIATIGIFADQLLEELLAKRSSPAERERPIMFLCHSLGGIVFKKALIRARERDRYEELLMKVRGVAFFGTPHRGSSSADWASILGNISNVLSLGTTTNTGLLKSLQQNSKVLQDVSESFVDRGKGLRIISFCETRKLENTNILVVNQRSASLLVPNETVIPLNGDHRSICRYSNLEEDRQRLDLVITNLRRTAEDVVTKEAFFSTKLTEKEQRSCLQELYPGNYELFKDFNVEHTPGTCQWLLSHERYHGWMGKDGPSLLWISANAGCGKSTLAKFLVDHLRKLKQSGQRSHSISHFFFKEGTQLQQNPLSAIRAILHQIFTHDVALRRHIFSEYETKGANLMTELNALFSVLRKIVRDPEAPTIVCILDGLDECPTDSLTELLQAFHALFGMNHRDGELEHRLKVVAFSRPEVMIKKTFDRSLYSIRLKGEDETKAIERDIKLVIEQCIGDLAEGGIPAIALGDFSGGLLRGADSTFLWVTLMIKILRDHQMSSGGISQKEIKALLQRPDIFMIYKHMLAKISAQPDSHELLRIVLAARNPLTIEEMAIALPVLPSHKTLEDISVEIKHPPEDHIQALCGHFIRLIDGRIHLVHQTAREFLQRNAEAASSETDIWQHSIMAVESHRTLLRACLDYLSSGERSSWNRTLGRKRPGSSKQMIEGDDWKDLKIDHPFLDYAASNWPMHFEESQLSNDLELFGTVFKFCKTLSQQNGFPLWTRARSDLVHFQGAYWDRGRTSTIFSKQAMIIFGLRLNSIVTYFLDLHGPEAREVGESLLHLACGMGSVHGCSILLERGADINGLNFMAQTPLMLAIESGLTEVPQTLIERGAMLNLLDVDDKSALHYAAQHSSRSSLPIAKVLLSKGVSLDSPDRNGRTPLWYATDSNQRAMTNLFISESADVNCSDAKGRAIAHNIADKGDAVTIAKFLSKNPKNINTKDESGRTPMQYIRRRPTMDSHIVAGFVE